MNIKVTFDQIVGWDKGNGQPGDSDYRPAGPKDRCLHFTIGKPGDDISGGLYIKLGTPVPDDITLFMPYLPKPEEPNS